MERVEHDDGLPDAEKPDPAELKERARHFRVEGLFDLVRRGCDRAGEKTTVKAYFDSELGYPDWLRYDEAHTIDEEYLVRVLSLTPR